jgi:hypothetical protein
MSRPTRSVTCTGCRSLCGGRGPCEGPGHLPVGFRPAPLRRPPQVRGDGSSSCLGARLCICSSCRLGGARVACSRKKNDCSNSANSSRHGDIGSRADSRTRARGRFSRVHLNSQISPRTEEVAASAVGVVARVGRHSPRAGWASPAGRPATLVLAKRAITGAFTRTAGAFHTWDGHPAHDLTRQISLMGFHPGWRTTSGARWAPRTRMSYRALVSAVGGRLRRALAALGPRGIGGILVALVASGVVVAGIVLWLKRPDVPVRREHRAARLTARPLAPALPALPPGSHRCGARGGVRALRDRSGPTRRCRLLRRSDIRARGGWPTAISSRTSSRSRRKSFSRRRESASRRCSSFTPEATGCSIEATSRRIVPALRAAGYQVTYETDGGHWLTPDMIPRAFAWTSASP